MMVVRIYRTSFFHDRHRWREPSLGRRQQAVVVAGCFMENKTKEAASIVKAARAAPRLDVAAALLAFQSALLRTQRRPGRAARGRPDQGFAKQLQQSVDRIGAVALLGTKTLRMNHDHAVLG